MDIRNMLKSVNMTDGDVLTLEKMTDRMEFEALPVMSLLNMAGATRCGEYRDQDDPNPDDEPLD